jgi:hypothetical protein
VGATSVDQSTPVVSPACIEEDVLDLLVVELGIPPDVARMREVPAISEVMALAISIVVVVTHWLHALSPASLDNAVAVDRFSDLDALHFISHEIELCSRLLLWLSAQSMPIMVIVVGPAMSVVLMIERTSPIGMSTIHVRSEKALLRNVSGMTASVVRVREVPASSDNFTHAISVVGMIAHWNQALVCTSIVDVLRVHAALDLHTLNRISLELEYTILLEELLVCSHTESVTVKVTSVLVPPVATPLGHHCTVPVDVEVGVQHTLWVDSLGIVLDVVRMRPVPVSKRLAVLVRVPSVITHRHHALRFASLQDIVPIHLPRHSNTMELHAHE